jgi:hypothetical protein
MSLFSKKPSRKKTGGRGAGGRRDSMEIFVKCDRCGEIIKTHIFKGSELYPTYSDEGPAYTLKKELIGSNCPNRVQLYMEFDAVRRITRQDVSGGVVQEIKEA